VKVAAHIDLFEQLTIDAVADLLPVEKADQVFTLEEIKIKVSRYYQVEVSEIEGESRVKAIAQARQMAIYLSREMTQSSFPALGKAFNRNHSTIMHAYNKAKGMLDGPLFRHELDEIQNMLLGQTKSDR
jgi:chromosomal replication initiator protein